MTADSGDLAFDAMFAASVGVAGGQVDRWLARRGVSGAVREDVALVVSELATNAVEASPGCPFFVGIEWPVGAGRFDVVVINHDALALPARAEWGSTAASMPGGRGLLIVAAVAAAVWSSATAARMWFGPRSLRM